jgi:hypothetical protein
MLACGLGLGAIAAVAWVNLDKIEKSVFAPATAPSSESKPTAQNQPNSKDTSVAVVDRGKQNPPKRLEPKPDENSNQSTNVDSSAQPARPGNVTQNFPAPVDLKNAPATSMKLRPTPAPERLPDGNAELPAEGFWPSLAPNQLKNWRIADFDQINMNKKDVTLKQGTGGNLLVTVNEEYDKCELFLRIALSKGSEVFLALRAKEGPQGWLGVTTRLYEEGGNIHAEQLSLNFEKASELKMAKPPNPDTPIPISFSIDAKGVARLAIAEQETFSATYKAPPNGLREGAVGVFVKGGSVSISHLDVRD